MDKKIEKINYEEKYLRLRGDLSRFRSELLEQREYHERYPGLHEAITFKYLLKIFDLTFSTNLNENGTEKPDDVDRVKLNDAVTK